MSLGKNIQPFFSWLVKRKSRQQVTNTQEVKTSIWRDTGQVYYLLNTLKLSYEGEYGPVTIENLNLDSLKALLSELHDTKKPHLKQKTTAGQISAYNISLCGVTWEENEDSTRVKAIAEAAMLRSTQSNFVHSQAVFKHESFLEHNDILNAPSTANNGGVFTYPNISIAQFVRQLEDTNASISNELKRRINVQPDNFKRVFSQQEQNQVNALLHIKPSNKDMLKE